VGCLYVTEYVTCVYKYGNKCVHGKRKGQKKKQEENAIDVRQKEKEKMEDGAKEKERE